MNAKSRMVIVSAVHPFPRSTGQQQRVFYKLAALKELFHLTFLTVADKQRVADVKRNLLDSCDEAIVLPSAYSRSAVSRIVHKVKGLGFGLTTGLKASNYVIGQVEFSTARAGAALRGRQFDCALFEYWHAYELTRYFRRAGTRTVLDMHDVLWRSYEQQWNGRQWAPRLLKEWFVSRYKTTEEGAWRSFDAVIAINHDEMDYTREVLGASARLIFGPMGTDTSLWPASWAPAQPRRMAYYGGLGSSHNQKAALQCVSEVMPQLWQEMPDLEFWIVGSNPPRSIRSLGRDSRVRVTGFVEDVQKVLRTMSLVLCPWSGRYGFRSRVVEVMSLGVPVIASSDAIHGMGFDVGKGILRADTPADMAGEAVRLIKDPRELARQSQLAHEQIERQFSFDATYGRLAEELVRWVGAHS